VSAPKKIRIGCGAGYSGDRIEPAVELAMQGELDYLVFECLAERTIAIAQQAKARDPRLGYDPLLRDRFLAVLPICVERGVRIITNMGAANPIAAAAAVSDLARGLGLRGLKVAAITGDDVLESMREHGDPNLVSANAYIGAEPICEALAQGADVIITGRVADPSLFVAPIAQAFGIAIDDWQRIGRATLIGHLLECAGQVTGGYFADPGYKDVAGLARLGFPLAEITDDGAAVITKVPGSGGRVTVATCTEQLLYEIHDPAAYITPDVIADFSDVCFEQIGEDAVQVRGGGGHRRPDTLKVSLGSVEGFIGEGQISYAGPGAVERACLALAIVEDRLRLIGLPVDELRSDLIGIDALHGMRLSHSGSDPYEVRARVAARTRTLADAQRVGREVEALYTNGPAGGGGATTFAREVMAMTSTLIARTQVSCRVQIEVV
jgi:hypothetical protein